MINNVKYSQMLLATLPFVVLVTVVTAQLTTPREFRDWFPLLFGFSLCLFLDSAIVIDLHQKLEKKYTRRLYWHLANSGLTLAFMATKISAIITIFFLSNFIAEAVRGPMIHSMGDWHTSPTFQHDFIGRTVRYLMPFGLAICILEEIIRNTKTDRAIYIPVGLAFVPMYILYIITTGIFNW